jgi:hypothetical protein
MWTYNRRLSEIFTVSIFKVPTSTQRIKCLVIKTWHLKMTVCWVVAPCNLVKVSGVSEVLAASIIRAIGTTTQKTVITHRPDDGGSKNL